MDNAWAERIANAIKQQAPEETASVEVMKYALVSLYHGLSVLFASLIIGAITGKLVETLITLIAFALLRFLSGGFHFESALTCFIFSTVISSAIPHIPLPDGYFLIVMITSIILLGIFAPSSVKGVTRIPEKYYPLLKVGSILLVSLNFFIGSELLAVTFFTQSVFTVKLRR